MKYTTKIVLIFSILLATFGSAIAQDNTSEEIASVDNASLIFNAPEGYEIQANDDNTLVIELADDNNRLHIFSVDAIESLIETDEVESVEELFQALLTNQIPDFEMTDDLFTVFEAEGLSGLVYESNAYRAIALTSLDDLEQEQLDAIVIIEGTVEDDSLLPFLMSIEQPDNSQESCVISTDAERTVRLHVGPGTNRTSVAFLPANQEFIPLGEAEANDGSRWFKVDKSEAAPNSSALEVWVASDLVTVNGDCTAVGEAFAPPVIPIIQQNPPSTSDDADNSGEGADSSDSTATTTTNSAFDVNNLGPAEITIDLQEGVYIYPVSQHIYHVIRVNESAGTINIQICFRSHVDNTYGCPRSYFFQLVGRNTFQNVYDPNTYLILNDSTNYGLYDAGGALIQFYVRVLDTLPAEFGNASSLEDR